MAQQLKGRMFESRANMGQLVSRQLVKKWFQVPSCQVPDSKDVNWEAMLFKDRMCHKYQSGGGECT